MTDPIKALIAAGEAVADALRDIAGDGHRAYLDAWESALSAAEARPEPAPDARNWPEDAARENGNYQNQCPLCLSQFVGHKSRVVCMHCAITRQTATLDAEMRRSAARPEPAAEPTTFDTLLATARRYVHDSHATGGILVLCNAVEALAREVRK